MAFHDEAPHLFAGMTLDDVDGSGAVGETAAAVEGDSRADLFRRAALGAGALFGGAVLTGLAPRVARGATLPRKDINILNFALTLEYLEAEFYKQALANIRFTVPGAGPLTEVLAKDERVHVDFVRNVLGTSAVRKPTFDFGPTVTNEQLYLKTSYNLENTGVPAYLGQAAKVITPAILLGAASIVTIEGRHCGAIAMLTGLPVQASAGGKSPKNKSFDTPTSQAAILQGVVKTGFIVG